MLRPQAKKYYEYARECTRQAADAESEDHRNKLTELARVWLEAALIEERAAQASRAA
jgi:hypothetical protein